MARNFDRERLAVSALIGATAVLCVGGALSQFLPLPEAARDFVEAVLVLAFAALCGFSLWVANVAAACAQVLADQRKAKPWAFAIALFTAALTGLVSVIGVDLAWMTLTGEQQAYPATGWIIAAGFALGFVKVAMGFVLEACEQIATREARAEDALLAFRDDRIRELERELNAALKASARAERELERRPFAEPKPLKTPDRRPRSAFARKAASAAAGAIVLAGGGHALAHEATPERPPLEPASASQSVGKVSDAERARARARIAAGESADVVSKETGVPAGTCRRWAHELRAK